MKYDFENSITISYGAIGDFCMLLYFLDRIHRGVPQMRTVVLATRNAEFLREMSSRYPFVEVVSAAPYALMKLFIQVVGRKNLFIIPPTFVDVPPFVSIIAVMLTAWHGMIAGFTGRARGPRYDLSVPFETKKLFYENLVALLRKLDISAEGTPTLSFAEDESVVSELGEGHVVLAPFASNPGKTLPMERWVALLRFLESRYPGREVVLVGGPADCRTAEWLIERSGHHHARAWCGAPFVTTATVIHTAACFIGADSGLTHVAGVLQVPSVVVDNVRAVTWLPSYNPHAVILVEPRECRCHGDKTGNCYREIGGIRYLRCMIDVPQERIENAITTILTHV